MAHLISVDLPEPDGPHTTTTSPLLIRVLQPAEFALLAPHLPQGPPHPDHSVVLVAQRVKPDGSPGKLAGFVVLWDTVHMEPFWVAPEYRRRPGLLRRLWSGAEEVLRRQNVPLAFALLEPGSMAEPLLSRMAGWTELPGKLWRFITPAAGKGAFKR